MVAGAIENTGVSTTPSSEGGIERVVEAVLSEKKKEGTVVRFGLDAFREKR